jgi:para-nitrobenzyl esterase
MVSPNHRLNVLGFSFLDRLGGEAFTGSSNVGLLDLVLALEWVRDNIEAFGGDPGNVTIFGQSGGGQKVSYLMAMPAARGLFHKAIIQSGPAPRALEPDYAHGMAEQLFDRLGLARGDMRALQDTPLDRIMAAYHHVYQANGGAGTLGIVQGFLPAVDGVVLPRHPFVDSAPSIAAEAPLLIGSTRTEMSIYALLEDPAADRMDAEALRTRAQRLFDADADRVVAAYRANHPGASPWELFILISADWPTRAYSIHIADHKAAQQRAPVYMYRLDWRTPVADGRLRSPHAIDIALVLDNVDAAAAFNGGGPDAQLLGRRMSGAWLAFARAGDPNTAELPDWPTYAPPRRATMLFDSDPTVADDPDGADRAIVQDVTGLR